MNSSNFKHFRPILVREAWDETPGLRGLRLDADAAFAELHRHPGQVIQVRAPGSRPGFFALANGPALGRSAELLVRRGHSVADAIVAAASPGAWLESSHPQGPGFSIEEARGRDVLLLATGSGITPIRALIQHLIERREQIGRVRLLYGQRFERDFAYQREHGDWERAKIEVALTCSRPGAGWRGRRGHVQDALRDEAWSGPLANAVAYLSGLPEMISSAEALLSAAGLPRTRILLNR